jgi:hypothetical protein
MWTGCLAHGLILAMKDFGKLEYVKKIVSQVKCATQLIRNSDMLASELAKLQAPRKPLVLLNPGETRFCSTIATCARLLQLKEVVEELAVSDVWATARSKAPGDRKLVFDRVRKSVERPAFWGSLQRITNAMEPMRDVLRLADSDEPSMGVAYASLINLRNSIEEGELQLSENPATANKRREDVKRIIDKRMEFVLKPVYRAAFALNPRYRTEPFSGEVVSET